MELEEQHGYRTNRTVTDLTFGLRMVIEKAWEYNQSFKRLLIQYPVKRYEDAWKRGTVSKEG